MAEWVKRIATKRFRPEWSRFDPSKRLEIYYTGVILRCYAQKLSLMATPIHSKGGKHMKAHIFVVSVV